MSAADKGSCYESLVGGNLRSAVQGTIFTLSWWRDGNDGVDYVLHSPTKTIAIEVSTSSSHHRRGLAAFAHRFPNATTIMVGEGGIPIDMFLSMMLKDL